MMTAIERRPMLFAIFSVPLMALCLYLAWLCYRKDERKKALTFLVVTLVFAFFFAFGAGFTYLFVKVCPFV